MTSPEIAALHADLYRDRTAMQLKIRNLNYQKTKLAEQERSLGQKLGNTSGPNTQDKALINEFDQLQKQKMELFQKQSRSTVKQNK
ncbi:Uncharacterised protein [BD1-7 clade bacterium]|uniref:Uncharacterized protein n=1 Tax=BD1-7 clade bacterium TaxID=2029982 RepID=A0A5S9PJ24_9GAMM|nr:Uncharacterised protein [BD1-7 clade bacterium]